MYQLNFIERFIYQLKLKSKLRMYLVVPLFLIGFMFSWLAYFQYQIIENTNEHATAVSLSIEISTIITLLQKERGLSQGYLVSRPLPNDDFIALINQREV